jgi:hypothetical protein
VEVFPGDSPRPQIKTDLDSKNEAMLSTVTEYSIQNNPPDPPPRLRSSLLPTRQQPDPLKIYPAPSPLPPRRFLPPQLRRHDDPLTASQHLAEESDTSKRSSV